MVDPLTSEWQSVRDTNGLSLSILLRVHGVCYRSTPSLARLLVLQGSIVILVIPLGRFAMQCAYNPKDK
jgi:hypothetical protein